MAELEKEMRGAAKERGKTSGETKGARKRKRDGGEKSASARRCRALAPHYAAAVRNEKKGSEDRERREREREAREREKQAKV